MIAKPYHLTGEQIEALKIIREIRQSAAWIVPMDEAAFLAALDRLADDGSGKPMEISGELLKEVEWFISNAVLLLKAQMVAKKIEGSIVLLVGRAL